MFRIHAMQGCPHCDKAAQHMVNRAVPFQVILADPITLAGVKAMTGQQNFPMIVCPFYANEPPTIIQGFNQGELDLAINKYLAAITSTSTPYPAAANGQSVQPPAPVGEQSAPQAQGTA